MNNRTSDHAGQPCTGRRGGHVPLDAHRIKNPPIYLEFVPNSPDILAVVTPAPVGLPCIDWDFQIREPDGRVIQGPHAFFVRLSFVPPRPEAPRASLLRDLDEHGRPQERLTGADGLRPKDKDRLLRSLGALLVRPKGAGGRKGGLGKHPDLIRRLVALAQYHVQEHDRQITAEAAAAALGISYSTLNRRLTTEGLEWTDIEMAASFESLREGLDYLASVQRERREAPGSDRE